MTPLEQFLVSLVGELASDLVPVIEAIVAGAQAGKSPIEVLADESVAAIVPEQSRILLVVAAQKVKYS